MWIIYTSDKQPDAEPGAGLPRTCENQCEAGGSGTGLTPHTTSAVTVAFTHLSIEHLKPLEAEAGSCWIHRRAECRPHTHPSLQSYFQRC